jgi:hypothetical protein
MGFLKKMTGGTDKHLLETGTPGRGLILEVKAQRTTMQRGNGLVERVCSFRMQVTVDNVPPYETTCKQRVPEVYLPQLFAANAVVAVRVNPADHNEIALDLEHEPPDVTMARDPNALSAAQLLATGRPAKAVIVQFQPVGMRNPEGVEIQAFMLTVMPEDGDPYQIQVGNPTPPEALPFLFPGSRVPVKVGAAPNEVVIDWQQAMRDQPA